MGRVGEADGGGERVREWAGTRSHRGLRWPEGARGGPRRPAVIVPSKRR